MRTVYFDQYFRWDDPNLRWGDPSYLLEPGDPGYVEPLPAVTEPTTNKKRKMKRNSYYPSRQGNQIIWLANLKNKLGGYAAALGLTSAQVTAIVAECEWLIYMMGTWLPAVRTWAEGATDVMTHAQSGSGSAPMSLPGFSAPALPSGATPQPPGALDRIFAFIKTIKTHSAMTEAMATDLGIIGSEDTGPEMATLQPRIKAELNGGNVIVKWGWQGHNAFLDMCEIHVDRGDGQGPRLLTFDTTPDYTDTEALPASLKKWTYTAIYRVGDARVGVWSAPASLNVGS